MRPYCKRCLGPLRITCKRERDGRIEEHYRCQRCERAGCILKRDDGATIRAVGPAVSQRRADRDPTGATA